MSVHSTPGARAARFASPLSWIVCCLLALIPLAGAGEATEEEELPGIMLSELAAGFREHCVRVHIHGKSDEGALPQIGELAADIRNERPTLLGGYWWDDTHVIIPDPVLHERFIRSLEIELPLSGQRHPARVAGHFVKLQALLLEVLPNESGVRPQASPLEFVDGDIEEAVTMAYRWDNGEWRIVIDSGLGASTFTDSGLELMELTKNGVLVSADGDVLGLAFGKWVEVDDEVFYWCGREIVYSPLFSDIDRKEATESLRASLAKSVLETRLVFRIKVDDDDDSPFAFSLDDLPSDATSERRVSGIVVGPRHLLAPLPSQAAEIARLEDIGVHLPDGRVVKGRFAGAFRDYLAIMVETEEDLDTDALPDGFTHLNPFASRGETLRPEAEARPEREIIRRWRVDYALGRRREAADYDRWLGTFRDYKGDTTVLTHTNEEDATLAFDIKGKLAAVALTPRLLASEDMARKPRAGFRPVDFLHRRFRSPDVFDPAMAPVAEEQGKRLVDFGVEYQELDANTARLFAAAKETRGGEIGLLVTHVYPGFAAEALNIREHDILLRLFVEGRNEPVELRSQRFRNTSWIDFDDMSKQSFQRFISFMPPPWPSRENALSTLLTTAGVGKRVVLDFLREGEPMRAVFTTAYSSPDYKNAGKEKFSRMGITVKPVTYEVARYFQRPANHSGVIISKAEDGGKGAVARLHHYLLITHVNGEPVAGVDDFRARTGPFEEGEAGSVELTVEGFGKTRLVKIE